MTRSLFRRLRRDNRGVTLVEFAFTAPIVIVAIMGFLDMAYRSYAKNILVGAVEKAARSSAMADNNSSQVAVDAEVISAMQKVNGSLTAGSFTFIRRNFASFTNSDKLEPSTGPGGVCATGFTYVDLNNNNTYDDGAQSGQGGAQDAVVYTVRVAYPTTFPVFSFYGAARTPILETTTILRNQPFAEQGARNAGTTRNCP